MKRLLNTLFVTTQGTYLARDGENILVRVERQTRLRLPVHNLGGVTCFGRVMCSPPMLGLCGERGVHVTFLSAYGKFLARMVGPVSGNVLLRREQYRRADDPTASAELARAMITGKLANARTVLQRGIRDRPDSPGAEALRRAANETGNSIDALKAGISLDAVRGHEGDGSRVYFAAVNHLLSDGLADFEFRGRSRRPPLDNMNSLLSFLYSLLASEMSSALQGVGLDPAVGFLHRDRPGRPSLALDLMEELRPVFADRLALSLVNRKQVSAGGFTRHDSGAIVMDDDTRKTVLTAWQQRKQEEIMHPFINEKIPWGLIPHVQALLLARCLRGDLDGYPPFIWK